MFQSHGGEDRVSVSAVRGVVQRHLEGTIGGSEGVGVNQSGVSSIRIRSVRFLPQNQFVDGKTQRRRRCGLHRDVEIAPWFSLVREKAFLENELKLVLDARHDSQVKRPVTGVPNVIRHDLQGVVVGRVPVVRSVGAIRICDRIVEFQGALCGGYACRRRPYARGDKVDALNGQGWPAQVEGVNNVAAQVEPLACVATGEWG
ncbi:MAG TPA: hypothetical protein EYQ50_05965 [Verrucomicrobiales bacterium]|nr:hypothetical protein [Verrucomicrobiales bacterium]